MGNANGAAAASINRRLTAIELDRLSSHYGLTIAEVEYHHLNYQALWWELDASFDGADHVDPLVDMHQQGPKRLLPDMNMQSAAVKFLYRLLLDDDDYLKFTVQLDHQASQAEAAHTAATTTTSAKKEAKAVVQENRAMLAKLGVPTFAQYVARVVWWEAAGVQEKVEFLAKLMDMDADGAVSKHDLSTILRAVVPALSRDNYARSPVDEELDFTARSILREMGATEVKSNTVQEGGGTNAPELPSSEPPVVAAAVEYRPVRVDETFHARRVNRYFVERHRFSARFPNTVPAYALDTRMEQRQEEMEQQQVVMDQPLASSYGGDEPMLMTPAFDDGNGYAVADDEMSPYPPAINVE